MAAINHYLPPEMPSRNQIVHLLARRSATTQNRGGMPDEAAQQAPVNGGRQRTVTGGPATVPDKK